MTRLVDLQMLRAVAALLVVADHALSSLLSQHRIDPTLLRAGEVAGNLGVTTFFIISGLIMYRQSASSYGQKGAALTFAYRRIVRVAPMYWIATFYTIWAWNQHVALPDLVRSLLFIPYAPDGKSLMLPVLGAGWTLNYEMFFYLLFAASLTLPARWGMPLMVLLLEALVQIGLALEPTRASPRTIVGFYTYRHLLPFAYGMVLAFIDRNTPALAVKFPFPPVLLALVPVAWIFWFVPQATTAQVNTLWPNGLNTTGLCCLAAVILCIRTRPRALSWFGKGLAAIGDASYSIYLFHVFSRKTAFDAWQWLPAFAQTPWLYVALCMILASAVGYAVHRMVELPLVTLMRTGEVPFYSEAKRFFFEKKKQKTLNV